MRPDLKSVNLGSSYTIGEKTTEIDRASRTSTRFEEETDRPTFARRLLGHLKRQFIPVPIGLNDDHTDLERTVLARDDRLVLPGVKVPLKESTRTKASSSNLETAYVDMIVVDRDFSNLLLFGVVESPEPEQSSKQPNAKSAQIAETTADDFVSTPSAYNKLVAKIFPPIAFFFRSHFPDPAQEAAYANEIWSVTKAAALASSCFLLVAWIATAAVQPRPYSLYAKVAYCSVAGAAIVPLLPMVAWDLPHRRPLAWQVFLFMGTWALPYVSVFDVWHCGFYSANNTCQGKDFIGILFYAMATPTFALFMLQGSRMAEVIGASIYIIFAAVFLVPAHVKFVRILINIILFHVAILWASFLQEKSGRRMFWLREQLRHQYKATQNAQVAERQASESKRRFVSYIFHGVRVPLNTALLAFQNLEGEGIFKNIQSDQRDLVAGLSLSLGTMEKVLNDVLDFNRMEAGKLTWTSKPFDLNAVFRSLLLAFRGTAIAREIDLQVDLDPAISEFSLLLLGDELRFGQIVSNLLSNACKFTQRGTVKCTTKLLYPLPKQKSNTSSPMLPTDNQLRRRSVQSTNTGTLLGAMDTLQLADRDDIAIIRVEIQDSGTGIQASDLNEHQLFAAYSQTENGLRQGGKGTGLGLSLVRQIIKLCRGRLGVQSVVGQGSTFWIEMAFGKPPAYVLEAHDREMRIAVSEAKPVIPIAVPASQDVAPAEVLQPADEGIHVLVVDDDPLTRKLMTRMLTRLKHRVTCAEDGLAALDLLRAAWLEKDEGRYDMVLLDNQMPRMTGTECAQEVRRIGMRVAIFGCTGNALLSDQQEYLDAGADKVLTKPILERNIKDAIELAKRRAAEIAETAAAHRVAQTRTPPIESEVIG